MNYCHFGIYGSSACNCPILSISQQPTKGPIYSILLSLMTNEHRSFVADCVTVIHHSLLSSIREGEVIPSILKVFILVSFHVDAFSCAA